MKLKPTIASYSGESYARIKTYLDDRALDWIARIAASPQPVAGVPGDIAAELVEMHVLIEHSGLFKLGTAVFLRDDIENILAAVKPLAQEFAFRILDCGAAFRPAPAEVTLFLAGLLGVVQGMGMHLSQAGAGSAQWKQYPGKYARSKVDFDELCDLYAAIGPDYLNKTVLQGDRCTAVFIGPGGVNFQSMFFGLDLPEASQTYSRHLTRFLVDEFAGLVAGEIHNQALYAAAEAAHLYQQGKLRSALITRALMQEYEGAVRAITAAAAEYWDGKMDVLEALLRSTASGRQGVLPANMMMHIWRYIRRVISKVLYDQGFFTDSAPQDGCVTVFYENDIEYIRKILL